MTPGEWVHLPLASRALGEVACGYVEHVRPDGQIILDEILTESGRVFLGEFRLVAPRGTRMLGSWPRGEDPWWEIGERPQPLGAP